MRSALRRDVTQQILDGRCVEHASVRSFVSFQVSGRHEQLEQEEGIVDFALTVVGEPSSLLRMGFV